jgi:predicted lipase
MDSVQAMALLIDVGRKASRNIVNYNPANRERILFEHLDTSITYFKNPTTDAEASVLTSKDHTIVYVVFRGSNSDIDWSYNRKFLSVPSEHGSMRLHRGFHMQWKSIEAQVVGYIRTIEENYRIEKIVLVGHSLGGALAYLSSVYLTHDFPNVKFKIASFGGPVVGDARFARWVENNIDNVRVVMENDPVPNIYIPFKRHVNSGVIHLHTDQEPDPEHRISLCGLRSVVMWRDTWRFHSLELYISTLLDLKSISF